MGPRSPGCRLLFLTCNARPRPETPRPLPPTPTCSHAHPRPSSCPRLSPGCAEYTLVLEFCLGRASPLIRPSSYQRSARFAKPQLTFIDGWTRLGCGAAAGSAEIVECAVPGATYVEFGEAEGTCERECVVEEYIGESDASCGACVASRGEWDECCSGCVRSRWVWGGGYCGAWSREGEEGEGEAETDFVYAGFLPSVNGNIFLYPLLPLL